MAVSYEQFEGDIAVQEDDIISSASEESQILEHREGRLVLRADDDRTPETGDGRRWRNRAVQVNKWPKNISIVHIAWGVVTLILGIAQVLVIPLIEDNDSLFWIPRIYKGNYFGIALWTALLLLLSGTLGLRATLYCNSCNLYAFVTVIVLQLIVFPLFALIVILAHSRHWISRDTFPDDSIMYPVTIATSVCVLLGLLPVTTAFMQHYEEVFCGDLQLCRRCLPCCCPRAVNQDDLFEEYESRPPSIPV